MKSTRRKPKAKKGEFHISNETPVSTKRKLFVEDSEKDEDNDSECFYCSVGYCNENESRTMDGKYRYGEPYMTSMF